MDRRSFTTALAAAVAAAPAQAFYLPGWYGHEEDGSILELLQRPNLTVLNRIFASAPRLLQAAPGVDFRRFGMSLILTPRLNTRPGAGREMIEVEIKDISRPLLTADGNAASAPREGDAGLEFVGNAYASGDPGILVRDVRTDVTLNSGETLVIGGLLHRTARESRVTDASIPHLGNLPVLGNVFRTTTGSQRHNELVIFITPRIITLEE